MLKLMGKHYSCADQVLTEGVQLSQRFFQFVGGSKYHYTISEPSSARQFRWSADDGPTLNAGLVAL